MSRILFTSPVQPIGGSTPNVYNWDKPPSLVKLTMSFLNHPGLCFLKANIPNIEILEYPEWSDFKNALKNPVDILGISFYINETNIVIRMIDYARKAGVKEIWAGNYGAFSPKISTYFDRIITGWGEKVVAEALGITPKHDAKIVHPHIYGFLGTNIIPRVGGIHGLLFTSRGCPYRCNYCQTPSFYGSAEIVPIESIDRILWSYAKQGITLINILDENFGIFKQHTDEVITLLKEYKFRWISLCRVDLLLKNFEKWKNHGLMGVHLGIESLNPEALKGASKQLMHSQSVEALKILSKNNMVVQGFYIIGFEEDTIDSIKVNIDELSTLDLDVIQVQVLTPYPQTALESQIKEKYGPLNNNLSKYNSRNLVWNHPNISMEDMRDLQKWANKRLFTISQTLRTVQKVLVYDCTKQVSVNGLKRLVMSYKSARLYSKNSERIKSAKLWTKKRWYPYEEDENYTEKIY